MEESIDQSDVARGPLSCLLKSALPQTTELVYIDFHVMQLLDDDDDDNDDNL